MVELSRRAVLAASAVGFTGGKSAMAGEASKRAWDFRFPAIEGGTLDFASFEGRVLPRGACSW